ncbi:MAG: anhydro-N-acetylmuramic acid kinase [Flavobacteriales bacterium]|nr:anhydro-N-acetylmuramic acid kinase [Flavobacteriales bacterium]
MSATNSSYIVAGLMSGTSLDGLDIAICRLSKDSLWQFDILAAKTFEYDSELKMKLAHADLINGEQLQNLHVQLGNLHGQFTRDFFNEQKIKPDFIASHGHTIFHQPEKGLTLQIGSPQHIAARTGIPVVADFRTLDVALGGQGAPLVPIGDVHLFSAYRYCLNLGGIANISIKNDQQKISAFDICYCNMALNFMAEKLGQPYDPGGQIASSGRIIAELENTLHQFEYYLKPFPKSLGKELFDIHIKPALEAYQDTPSVLATLTHHIADRIATTINHFGEGDVLITGGGAFNDYLIGLIRQKTVSQLIIPDPLTIQFKEALIFAFLGTLRWRSEVNCLASVTGASRDNCGGIIILPGE